MTRRLTRLILRLRGLLGDADTARSKIMTAAQYRAARRARGSQRQVAERLGVAWNTVARRERGELPINREAELAMLALPAKSA